MTETWTIARLLGWAAEDLKRHGSHSPRLDAELLLARVCGCDRIRLVLDAARPLTPPELDAFRALFRRRRRGEPVAYILGEREFYGRPFGVDARVLVPRPETEHLIEVALERTRRWFLSARALDLCTGSGCVAITLKKERPTWAVFAADISPEALEVARANCARHGAIVGLYRSDLFAQLSSCAGKLDLVTANPPYLPEREIGELPRDVREFEPPQALASGADGLDATRRIVAAAPKMLAQGGVLCVEIHAEAGPVVRELFAAAGFADLRVGRDYAGRDRVVSGEKP